MSTQPPADASPSHAHDTADTLMMERLLLFTDAVFAIIMTLLALDLHLPADAQLDSTQAVWDTFKHMQATVGTYVLSFAVVAMLWNAHLRRYRFLKAVDARVVIGTMLQLLLVGFVPFASALLAQSIDPLVVSFYAGVMLCNVLVAWGTWIIACRNPALTRPEFDAAARRAGHRRSAITALIFAISIPLAWYSSRLAMYSWALQIPVNRLSAWLERRAPRTG